MKRDTLRLSHYCFVETSRDINGRYFIAYSSGAAVFVRDQAALRKFLKIPKGIPMRESLDSWLVSLADMDAARSKPKVPVDSGLPADVLATGFGPECHLDEEDPNFQTKTIV